jgi:Sec-independent protein translocase protein TatA
LLITRPCNARHPIHCAACVSDLRAKKLPEIARRVGKYLAKLRQVKGELMEQISGEIRSLEQQELIEAEPVTGNQITKTVASAELEALSG